MTYSRRHISDSLPPTPPARRHTKKANDEEAVGELQVADYIVFVFALDCYIGWLQGAHDAQRPDVDYARADDILEKGISLLRRVEMQNLEAVEAFFKERLKDDTSKLSLLAAAMRPKPTEEGIPVRALKLRLVMKQPVILKEIFGTNRKALAEARGAIDAAGIDDPDQALNGFSALTLKNKMLERWIDFASEVVVTPGTATVSAVQEATRGVADATDSVLNSKVQQGGVPGSDQSVGQRDQQVATLAKVETDATEAARKALEKSGEEDRTLTKSEVIGVATAAATAIAANPDDPKNVPPALRTLDPEQRAAAMTGGKVRVSAGAGSGKSTTLLARVQYLIENGAQPSRMMAMSFNKKAADELAVKMAAKIGPDRVSTTKSPKSNGVQVGTMHSTFLKYISLYGTPAQRDVFAKVGDKGGAVSASALFKAAKDIWKECFDHIDRDPPGDKDGEERELPPDELWKMPPKSGRMMAYLNIFQGQGMSFDEAQAWASEQGSIEAKQAIKFYELYEGLKGSLGPGWQPNLCPDKPMGPSTAASKFVDFYRAGKPRIGDFNDMLSVFRDVIRDNPTARKSVQANIDHIMVDECQDLNPLQSEVLQLMTEHISTDDPKKSFWMVGDDKQSIYQFRGADPEAFIALDKQGFKDRQITTNYRCAPEFVDAANKLIANNQNQIPMEAKARPDRARGEADLIVKDPANEAVAAAEFGKKILSVRNEGKPLSDHAVLARTNGELAVYQQVCATLGIPFVQKKGTAVFSVPETESFKAFATAAVAESPMQAQDAFAQTLVSAGLFKPKFSDDKDENKKLTQRNTKQAFAAYCKQEGRKLSEFDPVDEAYRNPKFLEGFFTHLGVHPFAARKNTQAADGLLEGISQIRDFLQDPSFKTKDLFEAVLALPILEKTPPPPGSREWQEKVVTFRESTEARISAKVEQEASETDAELDDSEKPKLGALEFVKLMMEPNDLDPEYNPSDPKQFYGRFNNLAERAEELRIDPDEWEKKQISEGVPLSNRKPPPGVYLGTVHSTKGAEWEDVTLLMPKGVFPRVAKSKKLAVNEVPEESLMTPEQEMESERRLGYVGLTRAKQTMTVMCPRGVSPFIGEAGLRMGQNVPKPETLTPGAVAPMSAQDPIDLGAEEPVDVDEAVAGLTDFTQKTAASLPLVGSGAYGYDRRPL